MKTWIQEPLVQFFLIGAVLFGLYNLPVNQARSTVGNRIAIGAGEIEQLGAIFLKQRHRPPTEEELRELIESRIEEEVLYREALAMGLERDDTIVKRRLAQKLEFLWEDLSEGRPPTDEQLAVFFAEHEERYQVPGRVSFVHVYFSTAKRNQRAVEDAKHDLARLRAGVQSKGIDELGDAFFLDYDYRRVLPEEVEKVFGHGFADEVLRLPPGAWHGPIPSGYGLHLVMVSERLTSPAATLEAVRDQVQRDWLEDQRLQIKQANIKKLRDRYEVVVDDQAVRERVIAPRHDGEEVMQ